ncbi:MAG: sulfurtransferase [Azospirillaceae bacterium]|nr:sulfurtransferase [Azospirillaceae bacterium]
MVQSTIPNQPVVTATWLRDHLATPNLVILDVRSADDEPGLDFSAGHIPGARHSDYARAGWRVTVAGVPNQLPPVADLERLIGDLGIGNDSHVVIAAAGRTPSDLCNATRVYWTFRTLGHDQVSLLDGGFAAWIADPTNPIVTGNRIFTPVPFTATLDTRWLATLDQVRDALAAGQTTLLDTRSRDQFEGDAKSSHARAAGTLPGARHLPTAELYSGRLPAPDTLIALFTARGITPGDETIVFCNTGHLATLGWFALSEVLGGSHVRLYDGSMSEWSADPQRPLQTGNPDA